MITKKKFNIPIFNYKLTVVIYDDWKEVKEMLNVEDPEPKAITICEYGSSLVAVNKQYASSIVHEALHVKNNIWNYIGYRPQADNDEVDAYLLTYLYDKIVGVYYNHSK